MRTGKGVRERIEENCNDVAPWKVVERISRLQEERRKNVQNEQCTVQYTHTPLELEFELGKKMELILWSVEGVKEG